MSIFVIKYNMCRPEKLVKASFMHKDTIGFALFLAFYSGGFKLINGLLRMYL